MTAARLEELARKCDAALAPEAPDIASVLELQDIADLARCARGWAKVEAAIALTKSNVELTGYPTPRGTAWWYTPDTLYGRRFLEDTALEAVEAAEVTDANKG